MICREPVLRSISSSILTESVFTQLFLSQAMDCCTLLWPHSILKATKQGTRIYVFVGNRNMLVRIKLELDVNDCIPQFLSGEVYEADDDREAL